MNFSPPHPESDTSRSPPFPSTARKTLAFCNATPAETSDENRINPRSPQMSVSTSNTTPQFAATTASLTSATTSIGRFPQSTVASGRPHLVGENGGIVIQNPGTLVGANGAYQPAQFGHGTSLAVNGGEEGNSNLMWLLDFKLDFFNDAEAGKMAFTLTRWVSITHLAP